MQKNTEISERILKVLDILNVTANDFGKKLGYTRTQTIYDITSGKSAPSFDFFFRLYNSEYSETINPIWLITGKGEPEGKVIRVEEVSSEDSTILLSILERREKRIEELVSENTILKDRLQQSESVGILKNPDNDVSNLSKKAPRLQADKTIQQQLAAETQQKYTHKRKNQPKQ
ncbi:hypothetical protein LJC16_02265 [Bacteroidales bacterium OttesenSCG-928-C19]|nr:hypothetical protein [Bacteroidales bacterium OttesenSCG-928-C19]